MFGRAPLFTRTNQKERKSSALPRAAALLALSLLWEGASGCSLISDPDRKQCSESSECQALGFTGAQCISGLCQASQSSPASDGMAPSLDAGSVTQNEAGTQSQDAGVREAAVTEPSSSLPETGVDSAAMVPSPEAGMIPDAGGADACAGSCGECSTNTDCEQRGMVGGICADGKCWPAAPECSMDVDCASRGAEYVGGRCLSSHCRPNPRWRCEPPASAPQSAMKQLRILVRDSISLSPLPNIAAVVCQKLDLPCSAPVTDTRTGADGYLTLNLPANFAGYLKVEQAGYQPAMYFMPPVFPDNGELQPFPLLSSGVIVDALAFALGAGIDARRGHMMLIAEDCQGLPLPGVRFSSPQKDATTVQFYVRDLLPSTSAMETAEIGNGGYLNFPAGTAVLTLTKADNALKLTTVSVHVRPNFITVAYIRPDRR